MADLWVPPAVAQRAAEEKLEATLHAAIEKKWPGVVREVRWASFRSSSRVVVHLLTHKHGTREVPLDFAPTGRTNHPEEEVEAAYLWDSITIAMEELPRPLPAHGSADVNEYVIGYREWDLVLDPDEVVTVPPMPGQEPWPEELDPGESLEDMILGRATRRARAWEERNEALASVTDTAFDQRNFSLEPISTKRGTTWKGGEEVEANCAYSAHASPGRGCHCGWNLWHEPSRFSAHDDRRIEERRGKVGLTARVWGVVRCWGRVEVHWDGFRAQFAQPVALAYSQNKSHGEYVRDAAAKFGIASVPEADLASFGQEFGSPVPKELRPPRPPIAPDPTPRGSGASGLFQMMPPGRMSDHYQGNAMDLTSAAANARAAMRAMAGLGFSARKSAAVLKNLTS